MPPSPTSSRAHLNGQRQAYLNLQYAGKINLRVEEDSSPTPGERLLHFPLLLTSKACQLGLQTTHGPKFPDEPEKKIFQSSFPVSSRVENASSLLTLDNLRQPVENSIRG